jgi:hypothetical protein
MSPAAAVDIARRLCVENQVTFTEIWSYHAMGGPDPVHPGPAVDGAAAAQASAPKASCAQGVCAQGRGARACGGTALAKRPAAAPVKNGKAAKRPAAKAKKPASGEEDQEEVSPAQSCASTAIARGYETDGPRAAVARGRGKRTASIGSARRPACVSAAPPPRSTRPPSACSSSYNPDVQFELGRGFAEAPPPRKSRGAASATRAIAISARREARRRSDPAAGRAAGRSARAPRSGAAPASLVRLEWFTAVAEAGGRPATTHRRSGAARRGGRDGLRRGFGGGWQRPALRKREQCRADALRVSRESSADICRRGPQMTSAAAADAVGRRARADLAVLRRLGRRRLGEAGAPPAALPDVSGRRARAGVRGRPEDVGSASYQRLGAEGLVRLRARYAEVMARIAERPLEDQAREELQQRGRASKPRRVGHRG